MLKCVQMKLGGHEKAFKLLHAIFFAADVDNQSRLHDMLVRANAIKDCCAVLRPKLFEGDVEDSVGQLTKSLYPTTICSFGHATSFVLKWCYAYSQSKHYFVALSQCICNCPS